jgi:hypothetical protein
MARKRKTFQKVGFSVCVAYFGHHEVLKMNKVALEGTKNHVA